MKRISFVAALVLGLLAACSASPTAVPPPGGFSPAAGPSSAGASVPQSHAAATAPPHAAALPSTQPALSGTNGIDGQLAYVHAGDIWLYDVQTGAATQLTSDGLSQEPAWSPDGETIAFTRYATPNDVQDTTIWTMRADGSEPQQVTGRGLNTFLPRYAPGGELYYIEHRPAGAETRSDVVRHAAFEPSAVYSLQSGLCVVTGFDIGPDAQFLLALNCGRGNTVQLGRLDGDSVVDMGEQLDSSDGCIYGAAWPRTRSSALAALLSVECLPQQHSQIVLMYPAEPDRAAEKLLAGQAINGLAWSPNGNMVAYDSGALGESGVWIVPVDNSGPPVQIVKGGAQPAWRPQLIEQR